MKYLNKLIFISYLLIHGFALSAQDNNEWGVRLDTDKSNYVSEDTIFYNLKDIRNIFAKPSIVYIDLLNRNGEILESQMLLLEKNNACGFIINQYVKRGLLVLRSSVKINGAKQVLSRIPIVISTNGKPPPNISSDKKAVINIYPEQDKILLGFQNRVAFLATEETTGLPVSTKLLIKGVGNEVIGQVNTDKNGLALIDIALPLSGSISITNEKDSLIKIIQGNAEGFGLRLTNRGDSILVEVNRGIAEPITKCSLQMLYQNQLLFEQPIVFENDIRIVETAFRINEIIDESISFKLVSEDKTDLAQRVLLPQFAISKPQYNWPLLKQSKYPIYTDSVFNKLFRVNDSYKADIFYQLSNDAGNILKMNKAERVNDTLLQIKSMNFFGNASIRFYTANEYKAYQNFSITEVESNNSNSVKDSISIKLFAKFNENNRSTRQNGRIDTANYFADILELPNVTVKSKAKTRIEELEDKYVQSAFFKSLFSVTINVLDDPNVGNGLTLGEYLVGKIAGLMVNYTPGSRDYEFTYRNGRVDMITDEGIGSGSISMRDIALIKFIKAPLRGLNEGGGALTWGGKNFAGTTATLAIYTRKGNDEPKEKITKSMMSLKGIMFSNCN